MADGISSTQAQKAEAATAIVFEKRPRLGPELERQFSSEDVRVVECRSLSDVTQRSAEVARGVILLDLTFKTAECLRFLGRSLGDGKALPVFVVGAEETADLEWPVRELGATAFFPKTIPGHEMAELCRRQWAGGTQADDAQSGNHKPTKSWPKKR